MKKIWKYLSTGFLIAIILCSSLLPLKAEETTEPVEEGTRLEEILNRGELIVGTSPDFAPLEFIDSTKSGQAQYVGSDIELARYIAEKLGVKLTIVASSFDTVLANLSTGQIDLAITGLAYTPARAKSMELSIGYNTDGEDSSHGLMVREEDVDRYTSLSDFDETKTIAVQPGSLQESYVQNQVPNAKVQSVSSLGDAIELLKNKSVDAIAFDCTVGEEYAANNTGITMSENLIFETDDELQGNRVGAPLGEKALIAAVDEIIQEVNDLNLYPKWREEAEALADSLIDITETSFLGVCRQLVEYCWPQLLQGLLITLGLAFITVFFGTLFGGIFALIKLSKNKIVQSVCAVYIEIVRGTPLLLQLWLFVALFSNLTGGKMPMIVSVIIALIINSSAYVAEIIRGGILSVDKGQREAAKSLGMSDKNMMVKIIFPQAIKTILPSLGNEFVMMVKETSLASTFYVGELMTVNSVMKAATYKSIEPLVIVGIIYFVVTYTLSKLIKYMERRLSVSD